jgi:acyl-CoA reductase-like NAD-dependent aldehyde dehydrogenase
MRVAKALESGTVAINTALDLSLGKFTIHRLSEVTRIKLMIILDIPFGGSKQSGVGNTHGINGLDEWLEVR